MSNHDTKVVEVPDTMTTSEIVAYWQVSRMTAHQRLHRAGVRPISRDPGRSGENRYPTEAVKALVFEPRKRRS